MLFKKKKKLNTKSFFNIQGGSFADQIFFGGHVSASKTASFYRQSSAVATAIDMIAREIEQIRPFVKLKDGTLSDTAPVLDLLDNPNEFEDYREFIGQLARNYMLNHDAYIYAEGSTNRPPFSLFVVNNQNVSVTEHGGDRYPELFHLSTGFGSGQYQRTEANNKYKFYDGEFKEVYQIHGYSSRTSNCEADSPLEAAALEARQQILGRNHNLKIIENGGRLSMAVIYKPETQPSPEEFDEFKKNVMRQYSGSENAGKIAIHAASDMEIKELGMNNKDMDFSSLDDVSKQSIYMRYGIPLPLVSTDGQTFNNFDRAIEDLYDRAVLPYTEILFSGLTKLLKSRYKDQFEAITYNPETIGAIKGRMLDELKLRKELGIETTNELREFLPNREDIEGGDLLYQPATLIPAGTDFTSEDKL